MDTDLAEIAALPFRLLEEMAVPCGYERSIKFSHQTILANRYLLGFKPADTSIERALLACKRMNMPSRFVREVESNFGLASTMFLAFEAGASGGSSYRVYFEFMRQLDRFLANKPVVAEPFLLGKGLKWQVDLQSNNAVTFYHCLPGLDSHTIQSKLYTQYEALPDAAGFSAATRILEKSLKKSLASDILFIQASEADSRRSNFDLNIYKSGLTTDHVLPEIQTLFDRFEIPEDKARRLLPLIKDKLVGHISGGFNRSGQETFTIYYENEP